MPGSRRFEKTAGYIASQSRRSRGRSTRPRAGEPAITISRLTGAGALTLAGDLAAHLNRERRPGDPEWEVYDKNLIRKVLEDHNMPEHYERYMPEDSPGGFKDTVGDMMGLHPPNWELVKHTGETIHRLAQKGHCIIVGRGANVVTRDLPNVFHLRLVGSTKSRLVRCQEYYGISEGQATELMHTQDRARRRYLLAYYDVEIDDPTNYHLVINVDRYSPEALVHLVGDALARWAVGGVATSGAGADRSSA